MVTMKDNKCKKCNSTPKIPLKEISIAIYFILITILGHIYLFNKIVELL